MAPPVLVVASVEPKIRDVAGERDVPNRRLEARRIDHAPRDALLLHERANRRGFFRLGPFAMAQLDRQRKTAAAHTADQILQVLERGRLRSEAGRKLSQ